MTIMWKTPLFACALLLATIPAYGAADNPSDAMQYFGHVEAPCATEQSCKEFTDLVMAATQKKTCGKIDEKCTVGEEVLKRIFGTTYRQNLPDFIVYLDDKESGTQKERSYRIDESTPLLMWQGENTPHLLGARAIYVVVLAHHKLNVSATLTSDYQYEPNPLLGLLGAFKGPDNKQPSDKTSETSNGKFIWHPLNGDERTADSDTLVRWMAVARIVVPDNSINRVTVAYGPAPDAGDTGSSDNKPGSNSKPDQKTANKQPDDTKEEKYSGNFLAATGHFSNSPDSNTAVSFALGTTFNSKNTSIASGGSNVNLDGFAFAKFYIRPPYLYAIPSSTRYRPSIGIVLGTNVNGTIFNNIVLGVSYGHIIGNVGFIAGVNSIAGITNSTQGRKNRAFFGLEYTF